MRKEQGKKPSSLGRAILRRNAAKATALKRASNQKNAYRYTTDEDTKEQSRRQHLESVMERNALDEFLTEAIMKQQDFTAQRASVIMVGGATVVQVKPKEIKEQLEYEHIRIPRRPAWDFTMSPDELTRREHENFLQWRRELAQYEEASHDKHATPYEKNIEVWKQLWRVAERSHVLAQIVDARNPLLYYCQDLLNLAHELDPRKRCVLVVNKSDFLSRVARQRWAEYFTQLGIDFVFWSAKIESDIQEEEQRTLLSERYADYLHQVAVLQQRALDKAQKAGQQKQARKQRHAKVEEEEEEMKVPATKPKSKAAVVASLFDDESDENQTQPERSSTAGDANDEADLVDEDEDLNEFEGDEDEDMEEIDNEDEDVDAAEEDNEGEDEAVLDETKAPVNPTLQTERQHKPKQLWRRDPTTIVGRADLIEFLKSRADPKYVRETHEQTKTFRSGTATTPKIIIGMVGFPNVGKSSTINALMGEKKVSVAATPGHTKHFQTLNLDENTMLCDCPGLVFPTFVHNKATLVTNGVIHIATLRDYITPCELVAQRISRSQLKQVYGLSIPPHIQMDGRILLQAYARMRGFYKDRGELDESRAARIILKDFVAGKLLYCQCPPNLTPAAKKEFYESFSNPLASYASAMTAAIQASAQAAGVAASSVTTGVEVSNKVPSHIRPSLIAAASSSTVPAEDAASQSAALAALGINFASDEAAEPSIESKATSDTSKVDPAKVLDPEARVRLRRQQEFEAVSKSIHSTAPKPTAAERDQLSATQKALDSFSLDLTRPDMGVPSTNPMELVSGAGRAGYAGAAANAVAGGDSGDVDGVIEVEVTRKKIHETKVGSEPESKKSARVSKLLTMDPEKMSKKQLFKLKKVMLKNRHVVDIDSDGLLMRSSSADHAAASKKGSKVTIL